MASEAAGARHGSPPPAWRPSPLYGEINRCDAAHGGGARYLRQLSGGRAFNPGTGLTNCAATCLPPIPRTGRRDRASARGCKTGSPQALAATRSDGRGEHLHGLFGSRLRCRRSMSLSVRWLSLSMSSTAVRVAASLVLRGRAMCAPPPDQPAHGHRGRRGRPPRQERRRRAGRAAATSAFDDMCCAVRPSSEVASIGNRSSRRKCQSH